MLIATRLLSLSALCLAPPPTPLAGELPQWTALDSGYAVDIYGVDFVSPTDGWAVGWGGFTGGSAVLRTEDGGASWDVVLTDDDDQLFEIACAPGGRVVAVGQRDVSGFVLWSNDGGASFEEILLPSTFGLYDVELLRGGLAFVCGYDGKIFRTEDSGQSWVEGFTGTTNPVFRALSAVDDKHLFAVGGNAFQGRNVWATRDGGDTWSRIAAFGSAAVLSDLHFFDTQVGVLAGVELLRTVDGGKTWAPAATPATLPQAISFDGDVGWAVGVGTHVSHSTDAGATWTEYTAPPGGFLLSVDVLGDSLYTGSLSGVLYTGGDVD